MPGWRAIGLVGFVALLLMLAGCGGDDASEQPDAGTTQGETSAVATTGATGATGPAEPPDLERTAEEIRAELDETLADLREVESLDELRGDLEDAAASVQSWREQLAAAPEDEELADARAALEEALAALETTVAELSSQAGEANPAELGELARELGPDNLDGISEARAALDDLLTTASSG